MRKIPSLVCRNPAGSLIFKKLALCFRGLPGSLIFKKLGLCFRGPAGNSIFKKLALCFRGPAGSLFFKKLALCFSDLAGMLYPPVCMACGEVLMRQEHVLCLPCLSELPLTGFHNDRDNPVARMFWGRVPLEHATAFISLYRNSRYLNILHEIKYGGQYPAGMEMGRMFGRALNESPFMSADLVMAVPLHHSRQRRRGYNQSEMIARGMAEAMGIPCETGRIRRRVNTRSQTKKSRIERWENVEGIFSVTGSARLKGRHVLLVDDVVTTGATLEACALALLEVEGVRVSVAALAHVKRYD